MDAFVTDFDPASYFLLSDIVPNFGTYDSLMRMKGSSATETKPWLAQQISTNADKSVWTFTLRPGVKYSDGTPFDGNTLKAAYTRTITAQLGAGSTLSTYITDPGKQIVVKDPGTVVMDLGTPVPRFDLLLASQYGTGIVNPNVEKQGANHGHNYLQSHSAGTGAYMVQSAEPNNQIVLVRNPHYWGGWSGSHFKKIIIRQVPEDSDRRQGMESGDFDISFPSTPQDTEALKKTPGIFVGNQKVLGMEYVILGHVRAARLPAGPAGDEPAVPQRPVRVLGDEGDPRRAEQRPAGPDAVRGPRDLQAGHWTWRRRRPCCSRPGSSRVPSSPTSSTPATARSRGWCCRTSCSRSG